MPKAVGLDLDGTLIDSIPDLAAAANLMLADLKLRPLPQPQIQSFVGHGIGRLVKLTLAAALDDPAPDPAFCDTALDVFRERYRSALFVGSSVYPGIVELLKWLNDSRIPVCCITNKESSLTTPLLEQAQLAGYFDAVLCADTPAQRKPSPALLKEACWRFGIEPREFLYVGDSDVDQAAAVAAECRLLGVRYGFGRIEGEADAFVERADQILPLLQPLTRHASVLAD